MKKILSNDEISFLLKGANPPPEGNNNDQHGLKLMEALHGMFPRKRMGLVLFLLCISIIPLLGGHLFRRAYGEGLYVALWLITALAGGFLIMRNMDKGLEGTVSALRTGEAPPYDVLQRLVRSLAGLMLIMPGPVVNVLACILLLPPLSRSVAIFFKRQFTKYLDLA